MLHMNHRVDILIFIRRDQADLLIVAGQHNDAARQSGDERHETIMGA